jgi:hypothetical protein
VDRADKKRTIQQNAPGLMLESKDLEMLIQGLQNLYASVRFRPAPPSSPQTPQLWRLLVFHVQPR